MSQLKKYCHNEQRQLEHAGKFKKFKTSAKYVDFFNFNFCQRIIDFYEYENLLSLFFIKDFMKSTFHIDSYCRLTSHSVEKHENLSYRKNIS